MSQTRLQLNYQCVKALQLNVVVQILFLLFRVLKLVQLIFWFMTYLVTTARITFKVKIIIEAFVVERHNAASTSLVMVLAVDHNCQDYCSTASQLAMMFSHQCGR